MKYKVNTVKCDIGSYIHYWRGIKKVGKTTLFYNLVQEQYKDLNKGLLISIGDEIGFNALDGLVYAEAPTWADLVEIVDDLVDNKADNDFAVIALDTADEMIKLAKDECIRLHRKKTGQTVEFNACFGGYGSGRDKVVTLVDDILARLRKAGYGIIIIGHTKIRDIKEKNGIEYQQLTSNLSSDYDGIFANKADIVMTIAVEKEVDEDKHINGTTRYMWFRTDGFVDAGGRFADMPERVEYGAKNYIDAFEEGVKNAIKKPVSDKEIQARKKAEVEEREEKGNLYSKAQKESKVDPDRNAEILEIVKSKFPEADMNVKAQIRELMNENGISKFTDPDIPTAVFEKIVQLLG